MTDLIINRHIPANAVNLGRIPNKTFKKILRPFKYVETIEYWYDNEDDPDDYCWVDIEGIGYGWLWADFKTNHQTCKALKKFATAYNKNDVHYFMKDGIRTFAIVQPYSIAIIRVTNEDVLNGNF